MRLRDWPPLDLMTENDLPKDDISVENALAISRKRLKNISGSFQIDSRVLLAHILNKPQSWLLAHPELNLTQEQIKLLDANLNQLKVGIPLPYVIGEWEFFGLKFNITLDTLIPRPETEMIVETALEWLHKNPDRSAALDIGTGTGCIPISIAVNVPIINFTAVDISTEALNTAKSNAVIHDMNDRISFVLSDLFENIDGKFDLICSNPPYIPTDTLQNLEVFEKEPTLALDGGDDGLTIIRKILAEAAEHLLPGGMILIEIEARQGDAVNKIASENFPSADNIVKKDLAGHDRLLVIQT
jgi:release factor glutamine methyltransferase